MNEAEAERFLYDPFEDRKRKRKRKYFKVIMMTLFFVIFLAFAGTNLYYMMRLTDDIEKISEGNLTKDINYFRNLFPNTNETEVTEMFEELRAIISYVCEKIDCKKIIEKK